MTTLFSLSARRRPLLELILLLAACAGPAPHGSDTPRLVPRRVLPPAFREPVVDIVHYDVRVDIDHDATHVSGRETLIFRALPDREAHVLELDAVDLMVAGAWDGDGRDLAWSLQDDVLTLELREPLAPGAEGRVTLAWDCWPRRGLYFVGPSAADPTRPVHIWSQGQTHETRCWIPVRDFPDDRATHTLAVTVDARFLTMAAGRRLSSRVDESAGRRTDVWSLDVPHPPYLITLVAGELAQGELPSAQWPLPVVTDAESLPAALTALRATDEMLALIGDFAGRSYPYPKYAQVLVQDFVAGGQENISATTLTRDTLHSARDAEQELETTESLLVHEAMHQWFGDLLTCRDWSHLWLNEGFATYAEMLWVLHREGDEAARALVLGWQREMADFQRGEPEPVLQPHFEDPDELFDTARYNGAAGRLWLLHEVLGDQAFTDGVRRYVHEHEARGVTTADFRASLEAASGRDLRDFFEEWIEDAGCPALQVRIAESGHEPPLLAVQQVQGADGVRPVFHLPVQIAWSRGGVESQATLQVDAPRVEMSLAGDGPLDWVHFDARCVVSGDVDLQQSEEAWRHQLEAARDGVARLVAAEWFALDPHVAHGDFAPLELEPASLAALEHAARQDAFADVRVTALAALAARAPAGHTATDRALLDLQADPHGAVRTTVAAGLSERGGTEGAAALQRLVEDADGRVAAAALDGLVAREDPRAFEAGRRLATDPDPLRWSLRLSALRALARLPGEPRATPLLVAAARTERNPHVRGATLHLLHGRDDLPPDVAFRVLGEALWDASYEVRAQAALALGAWPAADIAPLLDARESLEADADVLDALHAARRALNDS